MPKKTTNPKPPAAESVGSADQQSTEEESSATPESTDDSPEEVEEDDDVQEEEKAKEDQPKPDPKVKPGPKTDPLIIEYAELLKSVLGKDYDKELDKHPLKERITTMKFLAKAKLKPYLAEGKVPKGTPTPEKPVRVGGYNFKELGQKYK